MTGKGNFKVKPIEDTKSEQVENDSISKTNNENKSVEKSKSKFSGQFEKLTKSKTIRRKKRFSIRTVSAIVGVRGTEFVVAPTDDSTKVLGLSGEVTLASPEVPNYEIPVLANQASHVNEGSGPSVPVTVTPAESEKIVSGEEKTRKPFEKIYQITIDRFKIDPTESIFIDDNLRNVKAAEKLNIKGIHFKNSNKLEIELRNLKIL